MNVLVQNNMFLHTNVMNDITHSQKLITYTFAVESLKTELKS